MLDYISLFSEGIEARLRRAFNAECVRRNWNLLLVYGRPLGEADVACRVHNGLFERIHRDRVDAVVLVSTLIGSHCGAERLGEFAQRYVGMPRCSLGLVLPNFPTVDVDGRAGMESLVEHVLVEHGYRRIAFMGGQPSHPHSLERLEIYRKALERHGLPFDPELVLHGQFMTHMAQRTMRAWLERGPRFDAIVCANDAMALGVMESLRQAGLRVPEHRAVTGFDDLIHARLCNPPLTTVAQPFEWMVTEALELVERQLDGQAVPELTRVPAQLVVRDSCGCSSLRQIRAGVSPPVATASPLEHFVSERPRLMAQLSLLLDNPSPEAPAPTDRLLQALHEELGGLQRDRPSASAEPEGGLIAVTRTFLRTQLLGPEQFRQWQRALEYLIAEFRPFDSPVLQNAWQVMQSELVQAVTTSQLHQLTDMDFNYITMLGSAENVFATLEQGALEETLLRILPNVGIKSVSLSRYVTEDGSTAQPVAHIVRGKIVDPKPPPFSSHRLFPDDLLAPETRQTLIVLPLTFEARSLGLSAFEYAPGPVAYHLLRDEISAALGAQVLQREIEHQSVLRERSVQERLATAHRIESLSVLAGGVAHDLNNVLGPLVALPELMVADLDAIAGKAPGVSELRSDIELFKTAGLRAAQTIKDLLTLSRQGRTPKHPLDLNAIVRECGNGAAARQRLTSHPRVVVSAEPADEPLAIIASEAHIVRAVSNLVHNALDAIDDDGEVRLRSYSRRFSESYHGYETIEPGDYAVIEVKDTGRGLEGSDLQRIFEPFYTTKTLGQRPGTGLGLAIVHGVVKEHEGYLDVVSLPGNGTTFTLYFPRSLAPLVSVAPPSPSGAGTGRILVVDDDPIQLRTCRRVLARLGYDVETTNTGGAAVRCVEKAARGGGRSYDLVLLDVQLGGGEDGLDVYRRIRQLVPTLKAVLASGHAPSDRIEAAVEQGLAWLQKPYTADGLAAVICRTLDPNQPAHPPRFSSRPPR